MFYSKDIFKFQTSTVYTTGPFTWSPWITTWQYIPNGFTFQVVAVRISPSNTLAEIDALSAVYTSLTQTNILPFFTNKTLVWKVHDTDTTISNGTCPFDRAVAPVSFDTQSRLTIYTNYAKEYSLTGETSYHYPLTITWTFGAKYPTAFYIELAVIGGGILLFLFTFISTVLFCSCLLRISARRWGPSTKGLRLEDHAPPTNDSQPQYV
jgi:hypothetical protein